MLDELYYYRCQQRVRSPPRVGYVRGGSHYSGGQYEVKSPYDEGCVRSPREYYKPSLLIGYKRPMPLPQGQVILGPQSNDRFFGVPNDQSFSSGSSRSVHPMMEKVVLKIP